ncbi:HERC1 [Symbiodinium natans]|uniref:HERC1 protein n=1 Tax=Symbiodinium natans TaxID=878477 RepID=A0A812MT95_9DINO|nr:HERC1 [Symbiodinium natans]
MSRTSSKDASTTTLHRIHRLLHQMEEEHAAEISRLKADVRRLSSASAASRHDRQPPITTAQPPTTPPSAPPADLLPEDNEGNEVLEQDSLRDAAACGGFPPPPTGTNLSRQDSPKFTDDAVAGSVSEIMTESRALFSPTLSVDLDAYDDNASFGEIEASPVRAIVYSLHGLPGSLLSGVETSTAKCKLVLKGESAEGCTDFVPLQQEQPHLPGQLSAPNAWTAVWEDMGTDVLIHVPNPLPETLKIELQIQGHETAIAEGLVTLNAERRKWALFGGGEVDAEIAVEKAETPAGRRRESTVKDRIVEKLERLFDVRDPMSKVVMPSDVSAAVKASRNKKSSQLTASLGPEDLEEVVVELKRIHAKAIDKDRKSRASSQQPVIAWKQFLDCIMLDDLPKYATGPVALNLFIVQQALLGDDMPSTGASGAYLMAYERLRKPVTRSQKWVNIVTAMSTAAIVISFIFLGLSLDIDPTWTGWIVLEGLCAAVFVAEVVVKSYVLTPRGYFCAGRESVWNLFDVFLSMVAVCETILNIVFATEGSEMRPGFLWWSWGQFDLELACHGLSCIGTRKAALLLRGLRLARILLLFFAQRREPT